MSAASIAASFSLLLNTGVLSAVTFGMAASLPWVEAAYGPVSPGRNILLAVYLAILVASIGLLFVSAPQVVLGLLLIQIIYKLMTPLTVGSWVHPVVVSNLGIAALHSITVVLVLREERWSPIP